MFNLFIKLSNASPRNSVGDEDKKLYGKGSLFGTKEALDALNAYYEGIAVRIKNECDPQDMMPNGIEDGTLLVRWTE